MPRGVYTRSPEHRAELARSLERNGRWGATNPRWAGGTPSSKALHKRLVRVRGRAAENQCVDCSQQAQHWSFKEPIGYSTNPDDYEPRCWTCHKRYDRRLLVEAYLRDKERRESV